MIKHIGIVSEGPSDFAIIKSVIKTVFNDDVIQFSRLWPEDDCRGRSTGWKGVWDFCVTVLRGNPSEYMNDITPKLDLIIIHLDGDVASEPEIFCPRQQGQCGKNIETNPLNCILSKEGRCPIPDGLTMEMSVEEKNSLLGGKIDDFLGTNVHIQFIRCIPCESIETWVVCAFEGSRRHNPPNNLIETIKKPADSIIAREAYYFGIKVDRESGKLKKRARVYEVSFAPVVAEKWEEIKSICIQARVFEDELRAAIISR